jgi:hypothetical protein
MVKRKNNKKLDHEEFSRLHNAWMDYSNEMTQKFRKMTNAKAKEYEELYKLWNEYATEMNENIMNYSPHDANSYERLQEVMNNYSQDVQERFVDIMGKDDGPYKDIYKMWNDYTQQMGNQLSELLNESMREQKDLYEIWMDSFGIKDTRSSANLPVNFGEINQFWLDMWQKSQNMYTPSGNNPKDVNQHIRDLNELWTSAYNKMVSEFLRSSTFAQMNGNILDANLNMKRKNDEAVNTYLEAMGFPSKENIDEIYLKLHEMDRKLSKITREVKSKRSSRKK